jgi:hypothetical protein
MTGDPYRTQAKRLMRDLDRRRRAVGLSLEALALESGFTNARQALAGRNVPRLDTFFRLVDVIEAHEASATAVTRGATLGTRNGAPDDPAPRQPIPQTNHDPGGTNGDQ